MAEGIPVGRERLLFWIVLGLLAVSTANLGGWATWRRLRMAAARARARRVRPVARSRRRPALLGLVPAATRGRCLSLRRHRPDRLAAGHLWHGSSDVRWYDYAAWTVYVSYFVVTYLLAGLLWFFARALFRRYVGSVALLAGMAFATFALFPAAPPWLASREGELDWTDASDRADLRPHPLLLLLVRRAVGARFRVLESRRGSAVAARGLHAAGHDVSLARRTLVGPVLLVAYPLAMAFALVYTAEHYLFDILLGWAYTVVAVWIVSRIADRLTFARARRSQ